MTTREDAEEDLEEERRRDWVFMVSWGAVIAIAKWLQKKIFG